jgi:tRNA 2-thiouridine synthesizing protein A
MTSPQQIRVSRFVDARGHRCPTPTLRLRRALEGVGTGDTVELVADDPMARIDVPHFAAGAGHELSATTTEGSVLRFWVRKGATGADDAARPRA